MKINYNLTGPERKKLVQTIAEILECDAKYLGAPSFSYQIDYFTIDKNGTLIFDDRADSSEIEELIEALCERGFEAEIETEESVLAIAYPRSKMSDAGIERLKKLLDAKGDLIKKALGVDALPIEIDDEKINFPWFEETSEPDEIAAYSHFLCALCCFSENQKRITCKATEYENEKFAFRTFLLRLGFIGNEPELKKTRKVLLSRLTSNSAYRKPRTSSKMPVSGLFPTEENTVKVDVKEAIERLNNSQVQAEIESILNGEEIENEDAK